MHGPRWLPTRRKLTCYRLSLSWQRPIVSICWGHRDSRLLMASGPALYVVRVEHRVSSLQLLCQQAIASALREDKDVSKLTLPPRLCAYLSTAFIPTIKVKLFLLLAAPAGHPRGARLKEGRAGRQARPPPPRPGQEPNSAWSPVSVQGGPAPGDGCGLSHGKGVRLLCSLMIACPLVRTCRRTCTCSKKSRNSLHRQFLGWSGWNPLGFPATVARKGGPRPARLSLIPCAACNPDTRLFSVAACGM